MRPAIEQPRVRGDEVVNRKQSNIAATKAVKECMKIIHRAQEGEHDCGPQLMRDMILDTLTAELLADGRTIRFAHIPETGIIGGLVQALINHGEWIMKEPVIRHTISVLYMLGEEERCKAVQAELRQRLSVTFG